MKFHSKPIWGVTVHETMTPIVGMTQAYNSIRDFHMGPQRGWEDIGYHFLVDPTTAEWRFARDIKYRGSHAKMKNNGNIGIGVLGTWTGRPYEEVPMQALVGVLECIRQIKLDGMPISDKVKLYTHHEIMKKGYTSCGKVAMQGLVDQLNEARVLEWL